MKGSRRLILSERGVMLIITLFIMVLLIGVGVGAIVSVQQDLRTSGNYKAAALALYIAEAGIDSARQELQDTDSPSFDSIFSASNGTVIVSESSFGGGTYTVTREGSSGSDRIKAISQGTAPNGARSEIEVWFRKDAGRPPKAVITNGELKIEGNAQIRGACGGAHSNDDMYVPGNPIVDMAHGLTASNAAVGGSLPEGMRITGNPVINGVALNTSDLKSAYEAAHSTNPLQQKIPDIPKINPAAYAPLVTAFGDDGYILHNDGTVTAEGTSCGSDGLCSGGESEDVPQGWVFASGTWKVTGSNAAQGIFYSETDVEISGNPGTDKSPWQATIISRGSIEVSGNPRMRPYPTSSSSLSSHLFIAGNDVELGNNLRADYAGGAILAHQQVKITGNVRIRGFIIAGDGTPTWGEDPFPAGSSGVAVNEISGNSIITFDCDVGCSGPGCPLPVVTVVSWQQKS